MNLNNKLLISMLIGNSFLSGCGKNTDTEKTNSFDELESICQKNYFETNGYPFEEIDLRSYLTKKVAKYDSNKDKKLNCLEFVISQYK